MSDLAKISAGLFFTLYLRFVNKCSFMESVNDIPLKVETSLLPVCFFHLSKLPGESPCFLKNEMKRRKGFPSSSRAHQPCHGIWKSKDLSLWLDSVALPWKWGGSWVSRDFLRHFSVCVPLCVCQIGRKNSRVSCSGLSAWPLPYAQWPERLSQFKTEGKQFPCVKMSNIHKETSSSSEQSGARGLLGMLLCWMASDNASV